MKHRYNDIVEKLGVPRWWDENGCPRYCLATPADVANIYANEVAFCHIRCQACGYVFLVAFSSYAGLNGSLKEKVKNNTLHYGDPPAFYGGTYGKCCHVGATMTSEYLGCVAFYERRVMEWVRNDEYQTIVPNALSEY